MTDLPANALANRRVLVRADLNVPVNGTTVTDTSRLTAIIPTLHMLSVAGARVILLSHLGRPNKPAPSLSLAPIASSLSQLIGQPVHFVTDILSPQTALTLANTPAGSITCLENLRFYPEEEANTPAFAQYLASLGDIYVNDAFSCSHRAHASISGITAWLPSYAGPTLLGEVHALTSATQNPSHLLTAIIGGSKVSTKIRLLESLLAKADTLVIGGAMANTFLAAQGHPVGASFTEPDFFPHANHILQTALSTGRNIILPTDAAVATSLTAPSRTCNLQDIRVDEAAFDLGPHSINRICQQLEKSATVIWNGPLGAFEHPPYHCATKSIAHTLSSLTRTGKLLSLAGGGDTAAALKSIAPPNAPFTISYLSLAGGAFLEWLENPELPGLVALGQSY